MIYYNSGKLLFTFFIKNLFYWVTEYPQMNFPELPGVLTPFRKAHPGGQPWT